MTDTTTTTTTTDVDVECIAAGTECAGTVEYRMPLSGSGTAFGRCEKHWQDRLDLEDDIRRRYPSSAPADFDPSYAGEHWDDDL